MPESKRQCSTCIFFRDTQLAGNGWCQHPQRQLASDVKILVRHRELACRNSWGDDLWQDKSLPATTSPQSSPTQQGVTYLNTRQEDEVTSVIDATARDMQSMPNDDVITATTIRAEAESVLPTEGEQNDTNSAAVADQDERARVMARGERAAILGARQRHARRRQPQPTTQDTPLPLEDEIVQVVEPVTEREPSQPARETAVVVEQAPIAAQPDRPAPRVTASVDLPRLRTFLGHAEEQARETAQPASFTTHYDHVLHQAEIIKERAATEPAPSIRKQAVVRPEVPAKKRDEAPSRLDMTFARARAAIYRSSPPPAQPEPASTMEPEAEAPFDGEATHAAPEQHMAQAPAMLEDTIDQSTVFAQQEAGPIPDTEFIADQVEFEDEPLVAEYVKAPQEAAYAPEPMHQPWEGESPEFVAQEDVWASEASYQDAMAFDDESSDDAEGSVAVPVDNTPSNSFWRSFNFGFKRRPKPAVMEYDGWADDDIDDPYLVSEAADDVDDESQDWYDESEAWFDDEIVDDLADDALAAQADYANHGLNSAPPQRARPVYVSSEENWELDLREFPDPQPVEWHETRSQLLATRPEAEPLDIAGDWDTTAGFASDEDALSWVYPEPLQYADPEPEPEPVMPLPPRRSFMRLDQEEGLQQFREALFGAGASASTAPRDQKVVAQRPSAPQRTNRTVEPQERGYNRERVPAQPAPQRARYEQPAQSRNEDARPVFASSHQQDIVEQDARAHRESFRDVRYGMADTTYREERVATRHEYTTVDDTMDAWDDMVTPAPVPVAPRTTRRGSDRSRSGRSSQAATAFPDIAEPDIKAARESGVPRTCLTCRSYEASDEPGRGWCTNKHASTHRQMVNSNELSCQSTFGNWWIRSDASWLPPESRITPTTPRTDRLTAASTAEEQTDSRDRRGVRTRKSG